MIGKVSAPASGTGNLHPRRRQGVEGTSNHGFLPKVLLNRADRGGRGFWRDSIIRRGVGTGFQGNQRERPALVACGFGTFTTCQARFLGGKLMGGTPQMGGLAPFAAGDPRFLRGELVRRSLLVCGFSSFAGNCPLLGLVHAGKSASFSLNHGGPLQKRYENPRDNLLGGRKVNAGSQPAHPGDLGTRPR